MNDDDSRFSGICDGCNQVITTVPGLQVVSITGIAFDGNVAFPGIRVDKDYGSGSCRRCCSTGRRRVNCRGCDSGTVGASLGFDGIEGRD